VRRQNSRAGRDAHDRYNPTPWAGMDAPAATGGRRPSKEVDGGDVRARHPVARRRVCRYARRRRRRRGPQRPRRRQARPRQRRRQRRGERYVMRSQRRARARALVRARAFTMGWMRGGEAPPATTRGPPTGNPQAERRALVPRGRGDRHRRGTLQMQARRCRRGATQAPPLPPRREGGAPRAHHCANKNVPQQRKKRSEERDTAPQRRRAAATTPPHPPRRRRRRRRVHAKNAGVSKPSLGDGCSRRRDRERRPGGSSGATPPARRGGHTSSQYGLNADICVFRGKPPFHW